MGEASIVTRLRSVIPYQGRSNVAFLCHEAADYIEKHILAMRELCAASDAYDESEAAEQRCLGALEAIRALSQPATGSEES